MHMAVKCGYIIILSESHLHILESRLRSESTFWESPRLLVTIEWLNISSLIGLHWPSVRFSMEVDGILERDDGLSLHVSKKKKKNLLRIMTVYELGLVHEDHWVTETWTDWQWLSATTSIIIMSWESHWCMHVPSSACMREAKDGILVAKRLDLYSIKGTSDRTTKITCCSLS